MTVPRNTRALITAGLLGLLTMSTTLSTHAASVPLTPTPATPQGLGATGQGGVSDPVVPPATQAQLLDHARRIDAWRSALAGSGIAPNGDPGNYGGKQGSTGVTAYAEPNSYPYRNYCGPGSSQVLISNWTSNVPTIDYLASQEQTNANSGTSLGNMVGPINSDAGTGGFYINQVAGSQGALSNFIGGDIYVSHHPLITAIETHAGSVWLNGWTYLVSPLLTSSPSMASTS